MSDDEYFGYSLDKWKEWRDAIVRQRREIQTLSDLAPTAEIRTHIDLRKLAIEHYESTICDCIEQAETVLSGDTSPASGGTLTQIIAGYATWAEAALEDNHPFRFRIVSLNRLR